MTTDQLVKLQIELEPVGRPWITISAGNQTIDQQLVATEHFGFEFFTNTQSSIIVTHRNKSPDDPLTAVIIKDVSFFGIHDPKFAWAGKYQPQYPEPWASNQPNKLNEVLCPHTYLGWNGIWSLEFEVPVFTWIHRVQNLGWIYD
jgi:hypothetical protein